MLRAVLERRAWTSLSSLRASLGKGIFGKGTDRKKSGE